MTKAEEYDEIANGVFIELFPIVARRILDETRFGGGSCLDLGAGGGHLGIALAKACRDLSVTLADLSPDAVGIAERRVAEQGLEDRVKAVVADVHDLPFADGAFDLVASRGSVWFWKDQAKALAEIARVLKPRGVAFIGGGFGNAATKARIASAMLAREPDWPERVRGFRGGTTGASLKEHFESCGAHARVIDDECGLWVVASPSAEAFE